MSTPMHRSTFCSKRRCFDLSLVIATLPLTLPLIFGLTCLLALRRDGPIFFIAERCGQFGAPFHMYKFRTLRLRKGKCRGVSDGVTLHLASPFCAWLRRMRLDELPQIYNIAKGDMSWIGSRPTELRYVTLFPKEYGSVLEDKPGLTGLATLIMHRYEDRILAGCRTADDCEAAYVRRCIPKKLKLDKIYKTRRANGRTFLFDCWILSKSTRRIIQVVFKSGAGCRAMRQFKPTLKFTKTRTN